MMNQVTESTLDKTDVDDYAYAIRKYEEHPDYNQFIAQYRGCDAFFLENEMKEHEKRLEILQNQVNFLKYFHHKSSNYGDKGSRIATLAFQVLNRIDNY